LSYNIVTTIICIVFIILYFKSKNKSKRDLLTGVGSREYIEKQIDNFIKSCSFFTVVFIDLDNFKKINDTLGHDYGDKLLIMLGALLKDRVKSSDKVGRLGGDEFIVLFKDLSNRTIIVKRLNQLKEEFKSHIAKYFREDYNLSLSIGACSFPDQAKTKYDLLKFSDIAMYESKKNKDKVTFFELQYTNNKS